MVVVMPDAIRRAAIIAVGSELLTPLRSDTNSLQITRALNGLGIDIVFKGISGDDRVELADLFRYALARVELVVLCGGLGPTDDDVTREVVADVLGCSMRERSEIATEIRQRFASRGLEMPAINRRQAMVPVGAEILPNANGTAPGLWIEADGKIVLLLPGPPRELEPILERVVEEKLAVRAAGQVLRRRTIRISGRSESHAEEALQPLYAEWAAAAVPVTATILAAPEQIELHLAARAETQPAADAALDRAVDQVVAALGRDVYSTDGEPLEAILGRMLTRRQMTVAVAESCTGGLVTSRLTDVPGSSRYVDRAMVCYSNDAKVDLLGVSELILSKYGAVSEEVALAMATGVRERSGTDIGVGITGIAGPTGGTAQKPVGTVAMAVVTPDASSVRTRTFVGDRTLVKFQASQAALDLTRRVLAGQ
jgi:nicotinamide-nucleotide amidase